MESLAARSLRSSTSNLELRRPPSGLTLSGDETVLASLPARTVQHAKVTAEAARLLKKKYSEEQYNGWGMPLSLQSERISHLV
ncbi:hypothetical protein M409DRAFT_29579 [Zasmidium cellare ATCC 36951]|uniref:Uncharacterized protein n=1 Tax=Zasmidium cellare ATCC 36951 TaxID=1080233 RepID=A0A6A6C2L2_ZASCE|nr:uncharacterized protein M409DRAFT_29579 [Zasmidium cellare ATCC 36951]KAF2159969.1 hypothetical protein M409DRAFT_29579 [Zasmidium cellare ATCC 36951]